MKTKERLIDALQDSTELLKYLLPALPAGKVKDTIERCIIINEEALSNTDEI